MRSSFSLPVAALITGPLLLASPAAFAAPAAHGLLTAALNAGVPVVRANQPYSAHQSGGTDAPVDARETPHPGFGTARPADPAHVQDDRGDTEAPLASARDVPHTHPGDQRGEGSPRAQGQRGSTDAPVDARTVPAPAGGRG